MVELGAVLGAMIVTLAIAQAVNDTTEGNFFVYLVLIFIGGPLVGALWGAAVAGSIHFVASLFQ